VHNHGDGHEGQSNLKVHVLLPGLHLIGRHGVGPAVVTLHVVFVHGVLKNMRDSLDKVNIVEMLVVVLLVLLLSDVDLTILLIDLLSVVLLQAMVVVMGGVEGQMERVVSKLFRNVLHVLFVSEGQFIKVVS